MIPISCTQTILIYNFKWHLNTGKGGLSRLCFVRLLQYVLTPALAEDRLANTYHTFNSTKFPIAQRNRTPALAKGFKSMDLSVCMDVLGRKMQDYICLLEAETQV